MLDSVHKVVQSAGVNKLTHELTTAEVADQLDVSVSTVNRWVRQGKLSPVYQFEGRTGARLFSKYEVEDLIRHLGATASP